MTQQDRIFIQELYDAIKKCSKKLYSQGCQVHSEEYSLLIMAFTDFYPIISTALHPVSKENEGLRKIVLQFTPYYLSLPLSYALTKSVQYLYKHQTFYEPNYNLYLKILTNDFKNHNTNKLHILLNYFPQSYTFYINNDASLQNSFASYEKHACDSFTKKNIVNSTNRILLSTLNEEIIATAKHICGSHDYPIINNYLDKEIASTGISNSGINR